MFKSTGAEAVAPKTMDPGGGIGHFAGTRGRYGESYARDAEDSSSQRPHGDNRAYALLMIASGFVEASDGTLHLVANLSDLRHACGRAQFPAMTK